MKYFIDTEFVESKHALITPPILLISIGIVAEDGREYYAQDDYMGALPFEQYPWIRDNVVPHLTEDAWKDRATIRREIEEFINAGAGKPEFWGWCAGYDFVVLCQLFGGMLELPTGFPHYIRDIQYLLDKYQIKDDQLPAQPENAHNALADAHYIKRLYGSLMVIPFWRPTQAIRESITGCDETMPPISKHSLLWQVDQKTRDRFFALSEQLAENDWPQTRMGSRERLKHQEYVSHRQPFYWGVAQEPLTIDLQAAGEAQLFRGDPMLHLPVDGKEMTPDFVGTWHRGEFIPRGDPRLDEEGNVRPTSSHVHMHISIDDQEITPEAARLIGGYVRHEGLATTGSDGGQASELVINQSDEETKE